MRIVILCCLSLLFLNCEDKKYKKEIESKEIPVEIEAVEPEKEETAKDESSKETSGEEKPKEPASEATPEGGGGKNKKINKLTSEEIDAKLKDVKEKTGGHSSSYAQALLARKEELANK